MREIIEEYANVIVGGTAAAVISGLMAEFFLGDSHEFFTEHLLKRRTYETEL